MVKSDACYHKPCCGSALLLHRKPAAPELEAFLETLSDGVMFTLWMCQDAVQCHFVSEKIYLHY